VVLAGNHGSLLIKADSDGLCDYRRLREIEARVGAGSRCNILFEFLGEIALVVVLDFEVWVLLRCDRVQFTSWVMGFSIDIYDVRRRITCLILSDIRWLLPRQGKRRVFEGIFFKGTSAFCFLASHLCISTLTLFERVSEPVDALLHCGNLVA
jgi:hypothetical protein